MRIPTEASIKKLILIGDRVLIKPKKSQHKTASGLYLPLGVHEKEKTQSGYIIKVGPGYPLPSPNEDEVWKEQDEVRYLPLQVREGDLAIFLQKGAVDVIYEEQKYLIIPQSSILMVNREEEF